ncbi:hypothetical protein [Paenibacillus sp. J45TS6]|uniref:hypothetical protein n=1 Tax=Paenibacillus sp. J45TS6 TaxID=2807196 RepID=UPI001BCADC78|nr:hypothetical protein [Paenibacillus sp. J45TS6]
MLDEHDYGIMTTIVHEILHVVLTKNTDFGQLSSFLLKVSSFSKRYKNTALFLVDEMRYVQEAIAVFYEFSYLKESLESSEEFKKALRDLERGNKKYYNYIKPLLFLFDINEDKNDIYKLVKLIGVCSLNVSIPPFTRDQLINTGKLKTLFTKHNISTKNKFLEYVNDVKEKLKTGESIEDIINGIASKQEEDVERGKDLPKIDIMKIIETDLTDEKRRHLSMLIKADEYLVAPDSSLFDLISASSMNTFKWTYTDYVTMINKVTEPGGTLYIKAMLLNNGELSYSIEFIVIQEEKRYLLDFVSKQQLNRLIEETYVLNAICCSPLLIDQETKELKGIAKNCTRNIYVMFNNSFAFTEKIFEHILDENVSYEITSLNFDSFDVYLLPYKPKVPILFIVFPVVKYAFKREMESKFNLKHTDFSVLLEQKKVNDHTFDMIELMVNTVMQFPTLK